MSAASQRGTIATLVVGVDVVDQDQVHPVHAESLQAVFHGAHDAIVAIVLAHPERQPALTAFSRRRSKWHCHVWTPPCNTGASIHDNAV